MSPDPRIERTRTRVLRAAYDVLAEVGYEAATVELLSERSGVSRSTMYRHWDSREAILRDAFTVAALGRDVGDDAPLHGEVAAAGSPGSALEALERYAETFARGVEHQWGRVAVTMAAAALDDPGQRAAVDVFVDGTRRDLAVVVDRAAEEGTLDPALSAEEAVTRLVDHVVAPLFYRHQYAGRPATADEAVALARQAWLLVGRPADRPASP